MGGVAGVVGDPWDQGGGVGGWELVEWQWKDVRSSPTVTQRVTQGLGGCGVEQVAAWQDVLIMRRWTAGEIGANHQMHKQIHRQKRNIEN